MNKNLNGSCLCGDIAYTLTGDPERFYLCHCNRCRKASGGSHASNIIMTDPVHFDWTRGEELLNRYKVPDAKRFACHFCKQCGSPMPRVAPDLSVIVIPAGSLDCDPGSLPKARIFWAEREDWSCAYADVPTYNQYPTA